MEDNGSRGAAPNEARENVGSGQTLSKRAAAAEKVFAFFGGFFFV